MTDELKLLIVNASLDGYSRLRPELGESCAWNSDTCTNNLSVMVGLSGEKPRRKRFILVCNKHIHVYLHNWKEIDL
jgi:hypothetical protein